MKKTVSKLLVIVVLTAISLNSCKKDFGNSIDNEKKIAAINVWLSKMENPSHPNRNNNIETLKAHLNYSGMHEDKDRNGSIIVIPIDNEFRSIAKISNESILNLVALVNKDGSIRNVHVAVYTASKDQHISELPLNTFHNIFNTAREITDGKYRFLSPAGTRQYDLEYKNGIMASAGRISTKSGNGVVNTTNSTQLNDIVCTDWYLITTYYDVNGSVIGSTSEYVGTTCSGCDNGFYESVCGDDGGGGGGSTGNEFATSRTRTFIVATPNDSTGVWQTNAYTTQDGFITNVVFGDMSVTHKTYSSTWTRISATATVATGLQSVTAYCTASVSYDNDPTPVQYTNSATYSYWDLQ